MAKWTRGGTLLTPTTKRWSKEKIEANDAEEGLIIFSDFTADDAGRSRRRVCTLNPQHSELEFNRCLIEHANEMLELLQDIATPKRGSEQENWTIEDAACAAAAILSKLNASISA